MDILEAVRWSPDLCVTHPISPGDIEGFSQWAMYGGFEYYHNSDRTDKSHLGHDFISYIDKQGVEHFGLDPDTSVRAIADGVVKSIETGKGSKSLRDYELFMVIEHNDFGLASGYCHVVPQVDVGDEVKKGQQIATLYNPFLQYQDNILPINLHLELGNSKTLNREYPFLSGLADPLDIIPGLKEISVKPESPFPPFQKQ